MAALPACGELAPASCAPCVFSAQNTYLEYPYHVVPLTVDLVPYIWQLNNSTNTTYISRITQTIESPYAGETGLIYSEGQTPVWTVDGVELTSGTTYAQFTGFVGAAATSGCAEQAANSEIALPASANPASLIYPVASETAVLNYLGSLQTVVAQLGGNQPAACPATITAAPQPTACITSSLSTSVTCYDYLYGSSKCVTSSRVVKRTVDLVERQDSSIASEIPVNTPAPESQVAPLSSPQTPTFASTTSSSAPPSSSSSSSSSASPAPVSTSTPGSTTSLVLPVFPSGTTSTSSLSSPASESTTTLTTVIHGTTSVLVTVATGTSSSASLSVSSPAQSPITTTITSVQQGTTIVVVSTIAPSAPQNQPSSSAAPSSTVLTTTLTRVVQGTTSVVVSVITAQPESQAVSTVTLSAAPTTPATGPPVSTRVTGNTITSISPRPQSPTYTSPPTITTSGVTLVSGTLVSQVIGTVSGSARATGTALPDMQSPPAISSSPTARSMTATTLVGGGPGPVVNPPSSSTTAPITSSPPPRPQVHTSTSTFYAGANGTSVTVVTYTGAADRFAAAAGVPVGGLLGLIAAAWVAL